MASKENEVMLVGTLLPKEKYEKFRKICEDIGSNTNETIHGFIDAVVDGKYEIEIEKEEDNENNS